MLLGCHAGFVRDGEHRVQRLDRPSPESDEISDQLSLNHCSAARQSGARTFVLRPLALSLPMHPHDLLTVLIRSLLVSPGVYNRALQVQDPHRSKASLITVIEIEPS
jgi:hypothetical protein